MSLLIFIILFFIVIRSMSFGVWCVKDKNILGGVSVFVLTLSVILSGVILLK